MKVQVLGVVKLLVRDFQFRQVVHNRLYFVSAESFHSKEMVGQFCGSVDTRLDCSFIQVGGYYDFVFNRAVNPSVYIPDLELLSLSPVSIDEGSEI